MVPMLHLNPLKHANAAISNGINQTAETELQKFTTKMIVLPKKN
jgi:hypothetical protein